MEKASTPRFCNVAGCRKPHQAVVSTLEPGTVGGGGTDSPRPDCLPNSASAPGIAAIS